LHRTSEIIEIGAWCWLVPREQWADTDEEPDMHHPDARSAECVEVASHDSESYIGMVLLVLRAWADIG
jgi:hypothetical protein